MDGSRRDYRVKGAIPLSRKSEHESDDPQELAYLRFLAKKLNFELIAKYRLPSIRAVMENILWEYYDLQNILELDYNQKTPGHNEDTIWILDSAMEHETVELIHRELPGLLHDLKENHGIEAIVDLLFESNGEHPTIYLSSFTGELRWSELPTRVRKAPTKKRK